MKKIILLLIIAQSSQLAAQNVGIGTSTPKASAILDIQSTNKGVLLPRMTTAQRKAIVNPETGLMVYDIDKKSVMMFEGISWGQLYFKNSEFSEPSVKTITDGQSNDQFGNAVAIDGDYAVAGAFNDDVNGKLNQGSAYVFHRVNGSWLQEAQLIASDGAANDLFGSSVSISENYIVVGAPRDQVGANLEQGSVYVFARNGINWTQQHKFVAADGAAQDHFGFAVAIHGPQFMVGCPDDDGTAGANQGSVSFYQLTGNNWAQEIKVYGMNAAANDQFGWSVSISNNLAIIGAPGDIDPSSIIGSAQVFAKVVSWTSVQKLLPSGLFPGNFGKAVAISGNTAVVTQLLYSSGLGGTFASGRVYVYVQGVLNIWFEQTFIDPPVSIDLHFFGASLSLSGNNLIVGSVKSIPQARDSANIAVYKRTGTVWDEVLVTFNSSPSINGGFGSAVFINGFNAIIGAPNKKNKKGEINFINIE